MLSLEHVVVVKYESWKIDHQRKKLLVVCLRDRTDATICCCNLLISFLRHDAHVFENNTECTAYRTDHFDGEDHIRSQNSLNFFATLRDGNGENYLPSFNQHQEEKCIIPLDVSDVVMIPRLPKSSAAESIDPTSEGSFTGLF